MPGISAKKINANTALIKNSKYLEGDNADKSTALYALKKKYCIKFPPIPSKNNIKYSNVVGVFQTKIAGMKETMLVTIAKYRSMVILLSDSTLLFTIASCRANKNEAAIGTKYNNRNEEEVASLLCKVINDNPKNPNIVAIHRKEDTFSFRKKIDKTTSNNGMLQKIATTSTRGKCITEYIYIKIQITPNIPLVILNPRYFVLKTCFPLDRRNGSNVTNPKKNLKNVI